MYQSHLVCAIKVGGKILREQGDTVLVPFGSEYTVFLKNLSAVRMQVKINIDGKDATEGTWLVIAPHAVMELERYIHNGNMARGNRFKFIERTGDIEAHRGIGAEDGLIRVEYKKELVVRKVLTTTEYVYPSCPQVWPTYPKYPWDRRRPHCGGGDGRLGNVGQRSLRRPSASASSGGSSAFLGHTQAMNSASVQEAGGAAAPFEEQHTDAGITVAGSESGQQFSYVPNFTTEDHADVIVMRLRGIVAGKVVEQPVTVDRKVTCVTCGTSSKGHASFCSKCGTALSII